MTIRGLLAGAEAALHQRTRWEHGHLSLLRSASLPLFMEGIRRRRPALIVAAMDDAVPPLALLALVWGMLTLLSLLTAAKSGFWGPFWLNIATGTTLAITILLAWRAHARHLPFSSFLSVPLYILWKLPIYVRFVLKRQKQWIRTPRPAPLNPTTLSRSPETL